jgi:chemotaxis protein MotB
MSDEEEQKKCPPEGLPAYMGTFADLMSLLMCFFVLLLAFSEMDVLKFKQIAGSMKFAFGVQKEVEVKDIPKGTSVIAREFSPGQPQPTMIKTIMQHTTEVTKDVLEFEQPTDDDGVGDGSSEGVGEQTNSIKTPSTETKEEQKKTEQLAKNLAKSLATSVKSGSIELLAKGGTIIIRIRESGSFGSGSAYIKRQFKPVLAKISELLINHEGKIKVVGHTDDIPIDTEYFPSNWELSSGRASSVVRELLRNRKLDPKRFQVTGLADTMPLVPNNNRENRVMNRRVEIVIMRGDAPVKETIGVDSLNNDG